MAAYPESWQEVALLTLDDGVTRQNFGLLTESFELNTGEKNIEGVPIVSGGRIVKKSPETDTEFTAKIFPVGVGAETETSMTGFWQRFQPQLTPDNSMPLSASNTLLRNTYKLAIMWAQSLPTSPADATASTGAGISALRIAMNNAYVTKLTHSFTTSDGLMGDISIKCPAFTRAGSSNIKVESTDGSGVLPVLAFP